MPDVYVYPRDPGREIRTSRGAVINLLKETQRSPEGGFSPAVGDGAAAGYNGNIAALLWSLPVPRLVFQPVNMEARTSGEALKLTFDRKFAITGTASDERISTGARKHKLKVGDTVTFVNVTGGADATWTGNKTVATVVDEYTITLTGVTFSTNVTAGVMIAAARDPYTLRAGTVIDANNDFAVRTLEDLTWPSSESFET